MDGAAATDRYGRSPRGGYKSTTEPSSLESLSSPHSSKLCLVCGQSFNKASFPIHHRSCMKKSVKRFSPTRATVSLTKTTIGDDQIRPLKTFQQDAGATQRTATIVSRRLSEVPMQDSTTSLHSSSTSSSNLRKASEAAEAHVPARRVLRRNVKEIPISVPIPARRQEGERRGSRQDNYSAGYDRYDEDGKMGQSFITSSLEALPNERHNDSPEPTQYPIDSLDDAANETIDESDRLPCPNCGRKFAGEDRLEKHAKACSKLKPRKVFDTTKARTKGTELEQYVNRKPKVDGVKKGQEGDKPVKPAKSGWRVKHDNFIKMVRSNRGGGDAGGEPVSYEPDPDLVLCEHCGRRFSEGAAERHVPICAGSKHRSKLKLGGLSNPQQIIAGAPDEALRKRMSFKPPPPKVKPSPTKKK